MAIQKKKLLVVPNPWVHIDHLGRECGACPCDPHEHTPDRRWVGARISKTTVVQPARSVQIAGRSFVQREASHDIEWSFDIEPLELPNTGYYRQRISGGELLAADLATAAVCGILPEEFVEPAKLLPVLKAAAIKQFDAENGVGAYEELGADRAAEAARIAALKPAPAAEPAKPAPASKQTIAESKGSA